MRIIKKIKGTLAGIVLAATVATMPGCVNNEQATNLQPLLEQTVAKQSESAGKEKTNDGWFNLQPAYNATKGNGTVRVEGSKDISDKLNLYGFLDADTNLQKNYGELRANYTIWEKWGIVGEGDVGNTLRGGISYTTKTGNGITQLRLLPVVTPKQNGTRFDILNVEKLNDKLSTETVVKYNLDQKTWYLEPTLVLKLDNRWSLVFQERYSAGGSTGPSSSHQEFIGLRYSF